MSREVKFFLLFLSPILAFGLAWLGFETTRTNLIGWFLVLVGFVFGVGTILAYIIRRRQLWESADPGKITRQEQGDRSFWLIAISLAIGFFLPPLEYLFIKTLFTPSVGLAITSFMLIASGTIIFVRVRRVLRKAYSGHLAVKIDQVLVQSGPYRFIRHPAYTGFLLMAIGISAGYESLIGGINLFLLFFSIRYRILVEEILLVDHFGQVYLQYAEKTKKLIPFIW